jgi:hypothetical protein
MRVKLTVGVALAAAGVAGVAMGQDGAPDGGRGGDDSGLLYLEGIARGTHSQPVYAVIGERLVTGRKHPAVAGLTLADPADPQFTCVVGGRGYQTSLACSDGSEGLVTVDPYGGCGHSVSASLCVGVEPRYAARKLTAPAGQRLTIKYGRLILRPTAG